MIGILWVRNEQRFPQAN